MAELRTADARTLSNASILVKLSICGRMPEKTNGMPAGEAK